ncbi:MAG: prealbumin-like fold domain-containing protein [Enhygromyxa sp.]
MRRLVLLTALLGGLVLLPSAVVAGPPPGMPDPSQMSGIPRPDPNLAPGVVTVRCLIGSFANPAIGVEVELEITSDEGSVVRTATTVEQGRATFEGLSELFGASATAKATIAGQELRSQAFVLGPSAGVAVMLVATDEGGAGQGAGDPGAGHAGAGHSGAPSADPHGGQGAVPLPGKPFPLEGRPRGTLIVGALDLGHDDEGGPEGSGLGPIPGVEIELRATAPGLAEPIVLTAKTDADGRAQFEGLDASLPEGAAIVVEGVLAEGEEPSRSQSFTLGETAYAVVLVRGKIPAVDTTPQQQQQQQQQPQRLQLPEPRVDKSLTPGQVRVFLIDAFDRPVADQLVIVHSVGASGGSGTRSARTDAQGMVVIDEVPLGQDMLSQVRVVYQGAPYSSVGFEMPSDAGALVPLRVYEPTADRTRVRSALQIDVTPRENDFATVSFNYAVFVSGDEAFWVPGGLRLFGPEGTRGLKVMRESEAYLVHDGEAPWVDLERPLEPGVELRLSFAVGIEHDGTLEIDWSTPFPLVDDASVVVVPERLRVSKGVAGAPEINPHAAAEPIEIYRLGHERFEPGLCDLLVQSGYPCPTEHWRGNDISIVVEDLPIRSRVWWIVAWSLFGAAALGVIAGVALRRRVEPREALLQRRDALMAELVALDERGVDNSEARQERARMLRALDRIYRQLEALGPK